MGFLRVLAHSQSGVPGSSSPTCHCCLGPGVQSPASQSQGPGWSVGEASLHALPAQGGCLRQGRQWKRSSVRAQIPACAWGVLRDSRASPGQKPRVCSAPMPSMLGFCL